MATLAEMGKLAQSKGGFRRLLSSPWLRPFNDFDAMEDFLTPLNLTWSLTRIRARIVERRLETPDCCTFVLRPNSLWTGFIAGQHVGVEVSINGRGHIRRYSVSSDPVAHGDFTITVKRQTGGKVSNWLHDHGAVGTVLSLQAAEGDFVLPMQLPPSMLMISGGSGITPIYAMLLELKNRRYSGSIEFVHVCRNAEHAIFAAQLQALTVGLPGLKLRRIETTSVGHPGVEELLAKVPDYAQRLTLLCGPEGLMAPVRKRWMKEGLEKNLLWERFSMVAPPAEGATSVKVSCLKSGRNFEASTGQPMLFTAEAAGLTPRYGCRSGICHTCRYRKRSGRVTNILLDTVSEEPNEMIQLCVSVPCSDVELEDL